MDAAMGAARSSKFRWFLPMANAVSATLAIAVVLPVAGLAQDSELTSTETPVTFSTGVDLVPVKVVVRDREGRAVGDLEAADFELTDNGKPQEILRFSVEEAPQGYVPQITAVPVDERGLERPDLVPRSQTEPAAVPERFIIYLFDDVHTAIADLARVREAAREHLEEVLDPATRVAIYTTSGTTHVDFTDDRFVLEATLDQIRRWSADEMSNDCPPMNYYWATLIINRNDRQATAAALAETIYCLGVDEENAMTVVRSTALSWLARGQRESRLGLEAFREVIRRLAAAPGERSVVYISSGFFLDRSLRGEESRLFDQAIRANVTINSLDARGLYAVVPGGQADTGGRPDDVTATFQQRMSSELPQVTTNVMGEFASATGGTFVWNDNGYQEGLRRLAASPEYTYILGFSPTNLENDGSFHELKIRLKNRDGLQVLARDGYYAPSDEIDPEEGAREEIRAAVFSREEFVDLPVDMSLQYFKTADLEAQLTVLAKLDVTGLKFAKAGDRNNNVVTVVATVFDRNGNFIKGVQRVLDMHLRDQTLERLLDQGGVTVRSTLDLPPGSYFVRLVVRDAEGATMAARNGAVEIPY